MHVCTAQAATNGLLYWASGGGGADQVKGAAGDAMGDAMGGGANGVAGDVVGGTAGEATAGDAAVSAVGGAAAGSVTARVLEISEIDEAYDEMRSFAAALAAAAPAAPALDTPIGLRVSPPVPTSGADAPADGVPDVARDSRACSAMMSVTLRPRHPDEDALRALRAMRAASPALQERWPDGESPRSWQGVRWSDDRVQGLDLQNSGLEVLAPQIGQLQALANLNLYGCPLKELPPQIGLLLALTYLNLGNCPLKELPPQIGQLQALTILNLGNCPLKELPPQVGKLLALTNLILWGCEQLTLAPGAKKEGQQAQTIVAAYARLLIIEPRKDTPGQLHAFLLTNPLAVPAFFKSILTDAAHADWLGSAVKAAPSLAHLTAADGRRAIDVAVPVCKQAMQAALFLLGRFDVDSGPLIHRSATAAVAAAADHGDPEAKPVPRVALKAMRGVEQVRAELEGRAGLDPRYVIAIKAVYADEEAVDAEAWDTVLTAAAGLEGIMLKRVPDLSSSIQAHLFKPDARQPKQAGGLVRQPTLSSLAPQHSFILVLELADRSLLQTIDHDQIAGKDWPAIRHIASDLGSALDHVHAKDGIHADFKPLNAVGERDTWKIIDFDVFCKVGEPFGKKVPSSGYCPPEMARVLLAATDQDTGDVDTSLLQGYVASEAYDLWSFGVVLYHLCFGTPLWKTDVNDNVDLEGLQLLASVSDLRLRKALNKALHNGLKHNASDELKAATALLGKLLEPDPSKRLGYFDRLHMPMEVVLEEPFFQGQSLDGVALQQLDEQMKKVLQKVSQIDLKIDQVLQQLSVQFKVLSTVLHGVKKIAPKLICFLPADTIGNATESWMSKINSFHARDLFSKKVRIFFLDPWRLTLAPTNASEDYPNGEGFELDFPKEWVVKMMPYVKLSLAILKVAYIAGRLTGFPIPDVQGVVGEWIDGQAGELKKLAGEATTWLSQQTKNEKLAELLDTVDKNVQNAISREFDGIKPLEDKALGEALKEPLEKSFDELDELLGPKYGENGKWKEKCGLVLATSQADGTSSYVLEADKAAYEENGASLFSSDPSRLPPPQTAHGEASAACSPYIALEHM
jgi:serine/threonine protein kinase